MLILLDREDKLNLIRRNDDHVEERLHLSSRGPADSILFVLLEFATLLRLTRVLASEAQTERLETAKDGRYAGPGDGELGVVVRQREFFLSSPPVPP
jgi:hypothetical protein